MWYIALITFMCLVWQCNWGEPERAPTWWCGRLLCLYVQVASARFSYCGRGFARFTSYDNQECMTEVVKPNMCMVFTRFSHYMHVYTIMILPSRHSQ